MSDKGLYQATVEAVRDFRNGSDLWRVADSLLAEVGQHQSRSAFEHIKRLTELAGIKSIGVSTMRQYRDVAVKFPPADRHPGLSFSAHRLACPASDPAKLLGDLVAIHGAGAVTVKMVKQAVATASGQVYQPATRTATAATMTTADLVLALAGRLDLAKSILGDPSTAAARPVLVQLGADLAAAASKGKRKAGVWAGKPAATSTSKPAAAASAKRSITVAKR